MFLELVAPDTDAGRASMDLEAEVFFEAFGDTRELLEAEYSPYLDATAFLLLRVDDQPAACVRLILGEPLSLKTTQDAVGDPWNLSRADLELTGPLTRTDRALDVGTFAVASAYRRASVPPLSVVLMHASIRLAMRMGVELFTAVVDSRMLPLINRTVCRTWSPYANAEPLPYLGSLRSQPCWGPVSRVPELLAAQQPDAHALFYDPSSPSCPGVDLTDAPDAFMRATLEHAGTRSERNSSGD